MAISDSLSGLMKWMERPEWAGEFRTVFAEHVGEACEQAGVDVGDLAGLLGDYTAMILFGCAFEDFLTRTDAEGGRNIVADYLKRRGWKESVTNKRYIQALRDSEMSLYEISEVVPGRSFLARDMVRDGKPVRVSEQTATKTLRQWDRLATRIVELNGRHVMSGGTLPFDHPLSEELLRELRSARRQMRGTFKEWSREHDLPLGAATQREVADGLALGWSAPLFSAMWLEDALDRVLGNKKPHLVNTDGDDIESCHVRFPLRPGTLVQQVRARLDAVTELRSDGDDRWTWSDAPDRQTEAPRATEQAAGRTIAVTGMMMGEDGVSLGNVELVGEAVVLGTNSRRRAARGETLLAQMLDGLVGVPLTESQTVDQMLDARPRDAAPHESTIPSEVQAEIVHAMLDKHYRAQLDQPVPALGDVSPRAAARTAPGRRKLVAWLKYLENRTAGQKAAGDPTGDYDFGWMWAELGVEALRK